MRPWVLSYLYLGLYGEFFNTMKIFIKKLSYPRK